MGMTSPDPGIGLGVHLIVCFSLAAGLLLAAAILRHRVVGQRRTGKEDTYECGEVPFGPAWRQVHVGFYLVALLFILFDVEAAFLFVWVLSLHRVGAAALWAMLAFLAVLLLGWAYAYRKGDLSWSR